VKLAERLPLADFPIPAYPPDRGPPLFPRQHPVLQRLPLSLRVLRHPHRFTAGSPPEAAAADPGGTRRAAGGGIAGSVYFVDDNFIGNKKAARTLLPHLVEWQRRRRAFRLQLSCEATLNIALCPDILAMMHEAYFSYRVLRYRDAGTWGARRDPESRTIGSMPLLDAVAELNRHGLEVVSGIILGLDTDTAGDRAQPDRLSSIASHIPVLTINLLQALPKTRYGIAWRPPGGSPTTLHASRMSRSPVHTARCLTVGAPLSATPTGPSDLRALRLEPASHLLEPTAAAPQPRARDASQSAPRVW
jgi:hypothetical protein